MKAIVHWYNLPEQTNIKLREEARSKIMNLLEEQFGTQKEIANKLNLTTTHLRNYRKATSNFSVRSLKRIANLLKINYEDINSQIIELGRMRTKITNPSLPFNLASLEGAALISIVNSEGHIPLQIGTSMHIRVREKEMLERAISSAKKIFGEFPVEIKKTKSKNTSEIFFPSVIADSLEIAGLVRGSKSKKNPRVPDYIVSNNELRKIYLGWSFACEMECSHFVVKLTRSIDITDIVSEVYINNFNYGPIFKNKIPKEIMKNVLKRRCNLLEDEIKMLKYLGINKQAHIANLWKTKDNRITAAWKIVISDKETMKKLHNINIPLEEKSEQLAKSINKYVSENILNRKTYMKTVIKARELQLSKDYFTRKELIDYYSPDSNWASRKVDAHLRKLVRKNIAKKISPGKYKIVTG